MNTHHRFTSRQRPPWWPENEEWPPKRWRHMRGRPIFRRMGCFFIIFNFFACVGLLAVLQFILAPYVDLHGIPPLDRPDFILPFGLLGILIFVTAVYWAVRGLRRMSMPLDDLLEASNKVAEGDYSVRVEAKGPPEIRSMMQGFNSMVERLQENDRQRRAMLADVSHELRTPITVIQGNVEGILDGLYPRRRGALEVHRGGDADPVAAGGRPADAGAGGKRLAAIEARADRSGLLVREVVSGFESQAKEKEIRVALELAMWMRWMSTRCASVRC
jgi:signal transduction histidine kinase